MIRKIRESLNSLEGHLMSQRTQNRVAIVGNDAMKHIIVFVCSYYRVAPKYVLSPKRSMDAFVPGAVCAWLMREAMPIASGWHAIAEALRRDHSTSINRHRYVAGRMEFDTRFRTEMQHMLAETKKMLGYVTG